jgi:hypothetical protein
MKKNYAQVVQVSLSLVGICVFIGWLGYFYLRLPHFKGSVVTSIEVSYAAEPARNKTITNQAACAKILETLKTGRLSSDIPGPTLGEMVLHFDNGNTDRLTLLDSPEANVDFRLNGALFQLQGGDLLKVVKGAGAVPGVP